LDRKREDSTIVEVFQIAQAALRRYEGDPLFSEIEDQVMTRIENAWADGRVITYPHKFAHDLVRFSVMQAFRKTRARRETNLEEADQVADASAWNILTDEMTLERFSGLSEHEKQVLRLRLSGLSISEIGTALEISTPAVQMRLHRIFRKVKSR